MTIRAAIFVEGMSDQQALDALARRRGRDLEAEGVSIVPMGGAHGIRRFLDEYGPIGMGLRLAGLCDEGEELEVRRALQQAGMGAELSRSDTERLGFFVCEPDLEAELIRALGAESVIQVLAAEEISRRSERCRSNLPGSDEAPRTSLRRFMGSGARRKIRYARLLVEALDLDRVPMPLDGVLAHA